MPFEKKQLIRGLKILLTVFYGFLLSSILFRYVINGIVETIRQPTNPYAIIKIVLGTLILVSIGLSIYATWYYQVIIIMVSGIVLIVVFILTLVFGIVRIVNAPTQQIPVPSSDDNYSSGSYRSKPEQKYTTGTDIYAVAEDVTKLTIELIFILFAILGTFILHRHVRAKYAEVPTTEPAKT